MHTRNDFESIESELLSNSESYDDSHPNQELAETFLVTIQNLEDLQGELNRSYLQHVEKQHEFQEIFFSKAINALQATYWLIKHRSYDSAHRNTRFLYETYLLLKELNDDKERARDIANSHLEETFFLYQFGIEHTSKYELESMERLHDLLSDARNDLEEQEDGYDFGKLYNMLSNKSIHPTRIEGALLDGEHELYEEKQLFWLGLVFCIGFSKEYWKIYTKTSEVRSVYEQVYPICNYILEQLDDPIPRFVLE